MFRWWATAGLSETNVGTALVADGEIWERGLVIERSSGK